LSLEEYSETHIPERYRIPEEYYECRLPVYAGFRFRKFSVPETMRLVGPKDLDILPDGRHLSCTGVIMELYASGRKEPRMFRKRGVRACAKS
jgi:hypothetical protein